MRRLIAFISLTFIAVGATFITNDTTQVPTSFEYIIVGGGTTGLAVANRLAVNHTVLVIERGTDERDNEGINDPMSINGAIPANVTCHQVGMSPPQVGSNGTNVRVQAIQYGNCLGGGSSVNTMVGSRPTLAGMNAVEALGNPGWGWDEFLTFMQQSETFTPPNPQQVAQGASFNASVHGTNGPVGVSFTNPLLAPQVQFAAKNATESVYGVQLTEDMGDGFSGGHLASSYHHIHFNETLQKQRRSSSAWSFLYPEDQQRSNLTVLTQHTVNTIVTSGGNGTNITATGVTLLPTSGGDMITYSVTREVIVSAGAPFSPAVLLRSGIGNATFLQGLGITPVLDLPGVGSNFQDQTLFVNISFPIANQFQSNPNVTIEPVMFGIVVAHATANEAFGSNGTQMVASQIRNTVADRALSSGGVVNAQSMQVQANVTASAFEINHPLIELFFNPGGTLSLWSQNTLPMSRGTVRINTTNPLDFPIVDAQYLTTDVDITIFTRAARRLGAVASTPPFSNLLTDTAYAQSGLPAVNASDDEWRTWTLDHYSPGVHFVGSNSMMPQEMGGVVSPQLLVYGTTNLRVADASIMPLSVFPHCTLGLYGVAEKAAAMILQTASTSPPLPSPTSTSPSSSTGTAPASASSTSPSNAAASTKVGIAGIVGAVLLAMLS
ncbi:alcohol oxidase [Dendrothele bispora CBS 962.96]|uniref:Alcohol oxidase n=1 Tax=Dendrothele bispora (strain CBS 962.96) TaxID=1314807 RepID=A0A4S8LKX6_DENBC|nr:alcohol oxidase [Dendrothele bispora CBS 962.96]